MTSRLGVGRGCSISFCAWGGPRPHHARGRGDRIDPESTNRSDKVSYMASCSALACNRGMTAQRLLTFS